jgi:hypothetical protein
MRQRPILTIMLVASVATLVAQAPAPPSNLRIVDPNSPTQPPAPSQPPPPPVSPTPPTGSIWGAVDPAILGTCSAAVHDAYTLDGADGFRYRTWHPQADPSGCVFAHEHGDDPSTMQNAEIRNQPVLFGYISRRDTMMPGEPNGHDEAHEGYKIFVANVGEANNEQRVNRVYSRSAFHMGTGGPKRFGMQFHSADIALIHPEFGLKAFTRLMMDTGAVTATVCPPRANAPTKDVMSLGSPCLLDSAYEIWGTTQTVNYGGKIIYQSFATPAVFDPITVFNPANPTEVVYNWDPRVDSIMRFPNNSRKAYRSCDRESYAQPGYWFNGRTGRTTFYTNTMGSEVSPTDPLALIQTISQSESVGAPATNDGLVQYKSRRSWCQHLAQLGLKN